MIPSTLTIELAGAAGGPGGPPQADRFGALIGASPPMRTLFEQLRRVCRQDTTVLLFGETGTGKELIARELHRQGPRSGQPFVVVDCAAIASGIVCSELFGHARGAFTGATGDRAGAFEAAQGGTLFLDEIGELDPGLQTHLLRVLEGGEVKRIGDTRYRQVDVRVIAATNRDLPRAVRAGRFRADLYYRLAVVPLRVPPLRERPADVPLLARALLPAIAARLGAGPVAPPPAEQLERLARHPWPGNVRQLRNYLERSMALAGRGAALEPSAMLGLDGRPRRPTMDELERLPFKEAKARWVAHFDAEYVRRLLHSCAGNVAEAGRRSGVDRVHLFRLIKKYGLRAPRGAGAAEGRGGPLQ